MYTSARVTLSRLAQAHAMWCRFIFVSHCHRPYRIWVRREHEKQSSLPPTTWRSE